MTDARRLGGEGVLQAMSQPGAWDVLLCSLRILFVFSSCFVGVSFVFFHRFPAGASAPQRLERSFESQKQRVGAGYGVPRRRTDL